MAGLKDFFPDRWDHRPNDRDKPELGFHYRYAATYDIPQLRRFFRRYADRVPSPKCWERWIGKTGWTVWIATRNVDVICGAMAARQEFGITNHVLTYAVAHDHPLIVSHDVLRRLLCLTHYETPEATTLIRVADADLKTQTALRDVGVVASEKVDEEHHEFRLPPAVKIGPRSTDAAGPAPGQANS